MNTTEPQHTVRTPSIRWFHVTPGRCLVALLVVEGLLWLSEKFGWLAWHKGYAVLTCVAVMGVAIVAMLVWFAVALIFRRRFQFCLRSLLLLVMVVVLPYGCGAKSVGPKPLTEQQQKQRNEETKIEKAIKELGGSAHSHCEWVDGLMVTVHEKKFTDADLERLAQFPQILGLDLSGTQITDAGLRYLKAFTKLRRLELIATNVTDAGLEPISGLTDLSFLCLDDTKATDTGLKRFKGLHKLEEISLNGTQVADAGLDYLKELPKLEALQLDNTRITDAGLEKLSGFTSLQWLSLSGTEITDAGLASLRGMTQLHSLEIKDTKVTAAGVAKLQQALPNCKIIR